MRADLPAEVLDHGWIKGPRFSRCFLTVAGVRMNAAHCFNHCCALKDGAADCSAVFFSPNLRADASGGALVNTCGQMIGVNSQILSYNGDPDGPCACSVAM